MPRRVKAFEEESSINNLDDAVNEFIENAVEALGGGVIDVKYGAVAEAGEGRYTAVVIYDLP